MANDATVATATIAAALTDTSMLAADWVGVGVGADVGTVVGATVVTVVFEVVAVEFDVVAGAVVVEHASTTFVKNASSGVGWPSITNVHDGNVLVLAFVTRFEHMVQIAAPCSAVGDTEGGMNEYCVASAHALASSMRSMNMGVMTLRSHSWAETTPEKATAAATASAKVFIVKGASGGGGAERSE